MKRSHEKNYFSFMSTVSLFASTMEPMYVKQQIQQPYLEKLIQHQ